jgi:predicted GNAT family N-acyltransferase
MPNFLIEIEFATPEYDETVQLRTEILRKPLGLEFTTDQLSQEYTDFHFGLYDSNIQLLGCMIFTPLGDGILKMRQVAIKAALQGRGLGKEMVLQSEIWAKRNNYHKIELHARETAIAFYKSLNYSEEGAEFYEVSIMHRKMFKNL